MCLPLAPFASLDHKVTNLSGDIDGSLSQIKTHQTVKSRLELTPALLRVRQEDCHKFKDSLSYMVSSRPF